MDETQYNMHGHGLQIGIYGWKKRCLYLVLLILLFVITLNITLVFWLMNVLHFDPHGMNYMQVVGSGIQFTGKTYVQDFLVSSGLFTRQGQPMSIHSTKQLTLTTTDHAGSVASTIHLANEEMVLSTPRLKVTDPQDKTLLSVDKDMVSLTADSLAISGEGGAILEGSLQSPVVSADIGSDLLLESATKGVEAVTPAGISIESRAGDILASSHFNIDLITVDGSIKLESGSVLLPSLRHSQSSYHLHKHNHHWNRIYQLCICNNGELFLGESGGFCEDETSYEICG